MSIVNCLGGKKIDENIHIKIIDDVKYIIVNDLKISLAHIPSVRTGEEVIYYTQIGMNIYIIYETRTITWFYVIEQAVEHNKMKIKNIYTTTFVEKTNPLERFFKYDEVYEKENITTNLFDIITCLSVITDKEFLKAKITEYLNNNNEESGDIKHIEYPDKYKSSSKEITYKGKTYPSMTELSKATGVNYKTLTNRLKRGLSVDEAIGLPVSTRGQGSNIYSRKINKNTARLYEYAGEKMTLAQLSEFSGITKSTLGDRLKRGMSVTEAIETPVAKVGRGSVNYVKE